VKQVVLVVVVVVMVVVCAACHRGSDLLLVSAAFCLLLGGHCSGIWRRSHATTIVGHRRSAAGLAPAARALLCTPG
jgi:hypothetical protein